MSVWRMLVGVIFYQGATIGLVGLFLKEHDMSWSDGFGLKKFPERSLIIGAAASALFLPIAFTLKAVSDLTLVYFGREVVNQQSVLVISKATAWSELVTFAILTMILAPIAEELIFRGILYPAIKRTGFRRLAWIGSAFLFAAIHVNSSTMLPLFAFALLLIALYEFTGNLVASIAAHSLFNAVNLVALYLQPEIQRRFAPHG